MPKISYKSLRLRLRLAICKIFSKCKIFSGENIFEKEKYFQMFSCIMKIVLENVFRCQLHSKNAIFLLVSHIFSASKQIYKLKRNKNQNKTFIKLKILVKLREGGRESDLQLRERERQIEKERDRAWVGHGCNLDNASGGAISLVLGCDKTGAIWGCVCFQLTRSALSSCSFSLSSGV